VFASGRRQSRGSGCNVTDIALNHRRRFVCVVKNCDLFGLLKSTAFKIQSTGSYVQTDSRTPSPRIWFLEMKFLRVRSPSYTSRSTAQRASQRASQQHAHPDRKATGLLEA
jgi:hypothetical protein